MSLLFVGHPKETDLALFAGGELGPLARWRIERHLQGCEWCRGTVADFFHLQGDLAELAELPSLDWDGMARQIRERLEEPAAVSQPVVTEAVPLQDTREEPRRVPVSPLVWRVGLAMAAAVSVAVVVYQIPTSPGPETVGSVAELSQVMPERSAAELDRLEGSAESRDELRGGFADGLAGEVPGEFAATLKKDGAVDKVEGPRLGVSLVAESESRADRDGQAGSDSRASSEVGARVELKEEPAAAEARPFPSDTLPADTPRPMAPTAQPGAVPATVPVTRASSSESAGETLLAEAIAPAQANEPQFRTVPRRSLSSAGMTVTGGLSIVPVSFGGDVEVGVSTDGWLRFRAVDSTTGNITITHVYAQ